MNNKTLSWPAYPRKDGRKGIRNILLIVYTVKCAEFVARKIADSFDCPDVQVTGFDGCTDNQYAVNLLISLIRHPNVGAVLTVGLGCEYVQAKWLSDIAAAEDKPSKSICIQDAGGTGASVREGISWCRGTLEFLSSAQTVPMTFSELVVGAECGGSDYTSGLAGNVVAGRFFDRLVDAGGTAIFEEIVEAIGLKSLLVQRAATPAAAAQLADVYDKMLDYCRSVGQYSISPGNFAGGLSTIEEKSMGAVIKSGSRPIQGVIKVSQKPPGKGLWLLDSTPDPHPVQFGITNPNDSEGLTALTSAGAHIVFLVTGRGSVVGSAVAPCIKITGNSSTFGRMSEDIDFNASEVLDGTCSMAQLTDRLVNVVIETASGKLTKAEKLGHFESWVPYKYQDTGSAGTRRCKGAE